MTANNTMLRDQNKINELLLFFLRSDTNPKNFQIKDISDSNWDGFVQESIRQRIGGLLYQRLKSLPPDNGIPSRVIQELRQQYFDTALRNMQLYHELYKVLLALKEAHVPVILLKGSYLAQGVYDNVGLRSLGDLDIMVKKDDIIMAARKLYELGYLLVGEYEGWDFYINYGYHFLFVLPSTGVQIELHWNLQPSFFPFRIEIDELWKRARPTSIGSVEALTLSPEDILLHICLQVTYQHIFDLRPLRSLLDITEILSYFQREINWQRVQQISKQWGASHNIYLTLQVVRESLNAAVPKEALVILEPQDFDPRLILWAEERMFMKIDPHKVAQKPLMSGRFANIYISQGLISKMSAILLVWFPPKKTMADLYSLPIGSKQVYFYYPVRFINLLREFSSIVWRLLIGDQETKVWIDREGKRSALMDWLTPQNQSTR